MDSATVKQQVMQSVAQQHAIENARQLVDKINEHCFANCVPKPGSSLSSSEQTCFTNCMEKYMAGWNQVNTAIISKVQSSQH